MSQKTPLRFLDLSQLAHEISQLSLHGTCVSVSDSKGRSISQSRDPKDSMSTCLKFLFQGLKDFNKKNKAHADARKMHSSLKLRAKASKAPENRPSPKGSKYSNHPFSQQTWTQHHLNPHPNLRSEKFRAPWQRVHSDCHHFMVRYHSPYNTINGNAIWLSYNRHIMPCKYKSIATSSTCVCWFFQGSTLQPGCLCPPHVDAGSSAGTTRRRHKSQGKRWPRRRPRRRRKVNCLTNFQLGIFFQKIEIFSPKNGWCLLKNHPRVGLDLVAVFCCPQVMPVLCQYNDVAGNNLASHLSWKPSWSTKLQEHVKTGNWKCVKPEGKNKSNVPPCPIA